MAELRSTISTVPVSLTDSLAPDSTEKAARNARHRRTGRRHRGGVGKTAIGVKHGRTRLGVTAPVSSSEAQPRRRIPGGTDTPVVASGSMGSATVSRKHVLVLDTRDTGDGEVPMNQVFFNNLLPEESWTRILGRGARTRSHSFAYMRQPGRARWTSFFATASAPTQCRWVSPAGRPSNRCFY